MNIRRDGGLYAAIATRLDSQAWITRAGDPDAARCDPAQRVAIGLEDG